MFQPASPHTFTAISSKATQDVLADLIQAYQAKTGLLWQVEAAIGGQAF
jgi:hypothetical protein